MALANLSKTVDVIVFINLRGVTEADLFAQTYSKLLPFIAIAVIGSL